MLSASASRCWSRVAELAGGVHRRRPSPRGPRRPARGTRPAPRRRCRDRARPPGRRGSRSPARPCRRAARRAARRGRAGVRRRVRQCAAELRVGVDHPADAEQLVTDLLALRRPPSARSTTTASRSSARRRGRRTRSSGARPRPRPGSRPVAHRGPEHGRGQSGPAAPPRRSCRSARAAAPRRRRRTPTHAEQVPAELGLVREGAAAPERAGQLGAGPRRTRLSTSRRRPVRRGPWRSPSPRGRPGSGRRRGRCARRPRGSRPRSGRPARSPACRPRLRSEVSAACRSAAIWACACSTIRLASTSAASRASAMIWLPCSRASSRMRAASLRASASCALNSSSAPLASALASSSSANSCADRRLAPLHRPVDRRDDVAGQEVEQQQERRQLDEERARWGPGSCRSPPPLLRPPAPAAPAVP